MPRSTREHSSVGSQPESNLTTGQAVAAYLAGLTAEDRAASAQELNSFAKWFGVQRLMRSVTPPTLENYQEQLAGQARTDLSQRLEALKAFFLEAKRQGWTNGNLAVEIKLKKSKTARATKATKPAAPASDASAPDAIRLTREGHDKLTQELEYLETVMRPQISGDLKRAAADKDFRENAPYDVAKTHQGQVEARIRELQRILQTGDIVEQAEHAHVIDLGSRVTLHDLEEDEDIVYTLVGPGEIDPKKGKISIQSPVGKALSGKVVGDQVEVQVPAGKLRLRVKKVERR